MNRKILAADLPDVGPLSLGCVYRRADLHARFGGNRYAGIVASKREPVVLLFHTEEPAQQFYRDGFDENGVYWYSGEGTRGDMSWTAGNRAVRDHAENGSDLLFFQRVERTGGLWRFSFLFQYLCYIEDPRPDREGTLRKALIFGLVPLQTDSAPSDFNNNVDLAELRREASTDHVGADVQSRVRNIYRRSEAVREYALGRARGVCEACGLAAPFIAISGGPFLEVHHIDRLADNGLDKIDRVSAICPNCHRRCHYGIDHEAFNSELRAKVAAIEGQLGG